MKAENLMAQPAPSPKSAGASLRSAVKNQTAAQSAKADKNDFGSALDSAKNSQKDAKPETRETGKPKTADAKQTDTVETKQTDAAASETKNADARETGAAEADEKAAEAANELPKNRKKEKSSKAEGDGNAESAEADSPAKDVATTLNAMLMAMAGNAQSGAAQTDAVQADATQSEAVPVEASELPTTDQQPAFASGALDSLLPQDAEKEQQAAQNQKLMDMLAGNGADVRLTDEQMRNLSSNAQNVVATPDMQVLQQTGTADVQILTQMQTTEPVAASEEIVMEQSGSALQETAVPAQMRTAVQENRTEPRDEKPQSLFAGVPLTVEDAVLDKVQTGVRQDLGDMMERQSQQQMQEQPVEAAAETLRTESESTDSLRTAEQGERQTGAQQTQQPTGAGVLPQGMSFTETMNAAAPTEAAPVQQAQDPYNVMQQIVDQARLIRSDANTEMVIRLNPEHLGELTLRVAVTASGAVNATFHTENEQVRGLLESSMIQLKQELQQQGLKVNNVDVQSGLSEDFFAQSQAGQQGYQQPQQSQRNQAADRRSFENDADALAVNPAAGDAAATAQTPNAGESDGVNYLV